MPHLTLEYSANVAAPADFSFLFKKLHDLLSVTGGINIENCKSRAYIADIFFIGTGGASNGFVHLDIRFLEGRSSETRIQLGKEALDILIACFHESNPSLDLQITVEVQDIMRSFYFKYPEGTLTPLSV